MARSSAPLTRDRIVAVAGRLADRDGLGGLSMRSLARELGVEAMSLYHHVPNKEALLDGMVDVVFAEFHDPDAAGEWREELRQRAHSGRAAMKRHRWAVGLMDSRRDPGPRTLRHHDAVLGCLRGAGFDLAMTGHAVALLDAHLYGFVVQEVALPFTEDSEIGDLADAMLAGVPEGRLVHLTEFAREHATRPGYSFAAEFDWGLELVLDGLAARL